MAVQQNRNNSEAKPKKAALKRKPAISVFTPEQLHEKIAQKAYELYENRGKTQGDAAQDWINAKQIVYTELGLSEEIV